MGNTIYVAPIKKGLSLGQMVEKLSRGPVKFSDGVVVIYGNGFWDGGIWECCSQRNQSGKKLGRLDGPIGDDVIETIQQKGLVLYARKHKKAVSSILSSHDYDVVELGYGYV